MGRKSNMRNGEISDEEIRIVLGSLPSYSLDDYYRSERLADENIRKAPAGVMYLHRLCSDEMVVDGFHYPNFVSYFQGLMCILLDSLKKRERAVRVFAALIADYEKRGKLTRVSMKENRMYAKCMRKYGFGKLIPYFPEKSMKDEIDCPFDCRLRLDAYYNEDKDLLPEWCGFSTFSMFAVMMARALFGGGFPNYKRVVELIFFAEDNGKVDLTADAHVPESFADAADDTEDVAFLADAFCLCEEEIRILQCEYNLSVIYNFDRIDTMFRKRYSKDDDYGEWLEDKYFVLLDFGKKDVAKCLGDRSKLKCYGLVSNGIIDEDTREAILNRNIGILFGDIMVQDDLKKTHPISTFQVDGDNTALLKGMLNSQEPLNLLVYGPAGVGKTEYIRSLAKECGLDCFFFRNERELHGKKEVDPMLRLYAFASIKNTDRLVVVDEAENILNSTSSFFDLESDHAARKGVVNKMLDGCGSKVAWILNDIEAADGTTLRRMTYSVEMTRFGREYFKKLLRYRLAEENLPLELRERILKLSGSYEVSLATIDNIMKAIGSADKRGGENA